MISLPEFHSKLGRAEWAKRALAARGDWSGLATKRRQIEEGEKKEQSNDQTTTDRTDRDWEMPTTNPRLRGPLPLHEAYQRMLAGHRLCYNIPAHTGEHSTAPSGLGGAGGYGARDIVAEAVAALGRFDKVRMANPAQNQYNINPGTIIGTACLPSPRLFLGDYREIARSAVLVAEANAMVPDNVAWTSNTSTNLGRRFKVTRRAAAARGSYWMESIECNGTVVWDDDPSESKPTETTEEPIRPNAKDSEVTCFTSRQRQGAAKGYIAL
ncbi:hypothetical protein PgNI_05260 [Pyricularia grisea]|uniref:Uncharacterized protein n=1 Tax=Pyricularia grisea TaxID=148305 RepID=A0A6P8B768_PYRGI|nr:hypothetical protein PgNI_05260 [Pyricularia grisea]TLD11157.1 hypothetical protein PgNI_05260 [Pyricularia grisea]